MKDLRNSCLKQNHVCRKITKLLLFQNDIVMEILPFEKDFLPSRLGILITITESAAKMS